MFCLAHPFCLPGALTDTLSHLIMIPACNRSQLQLRKERLFWAERLFCPYLVSIRTYKLIHARNRSRMPADGLALSAPAPSIAAIRICVALSTPVLAPVGQCRDSTPLSTPLVPFCHHYATILQSLPVV